jgi:energy-coupling factor transporter ATP-binding protein EcfA2
MKWTEEDAINHLDNILDMTDDIKIGEVTILTGSNGSGKSLIRKLMPACLIKQFKDIGVKVKENCVSSISMQSRTESKPEWGALSCMMHDTGWAPTSTSTWNLIKGVIGTDNYIVIDEPEIGCSKEIQLSICEAINSFVIKKKNECDFKGMLIITHSELICNIVNHDAFINLNGLSEKEWIERDLIIYDLEDLQNNSNLLHSVVQKRINEKNNKK